MHITFIILAVFAAACLAGYIEFRKHKTAVLAELSLLKTKFKAEAALRDFHELDKL